MMNTLTNSTTVLAELAILLRLTRTEGQVARVRTTQASTEDIRREAAENARHADVRAASIQRAIRRLGGAPDVFGDAVGRVAAMTKATLEQAQPFSEALFADLALEHQLHDRAVFTRVLAEAQAESAVVTLMRQLESAHLETIAWITVRLAEVAQGGPTALSPTPAQAAVSTATRIALLPSRQGAALFNKVVNLVQRGRNSAEQAVQTTSEKVRVTSKVTSEVVAAGRNAALARAEEVAPSANVRKAAHETREDLGTIEANDLPIKGYDNMASDAAIKAIKKLGTAENVRIVLRFEQAHQNRKGVSSAAQQRMTDFAEQMVNA